MDSVMKRLIVAVLTLLLPAGAVAQTVQQYTTVASITALKAMTNRPQVIEVVDANPGTFNLSQGACSAADDVFQVQPTSGSTVCYTRMGTPYALGKSATTNGVAITSGTGVPSISSTLPSALTIPAATLTGTSTFSSGIASFPGTSQIKGVQTTYPDALTWLNSSSGTFVYGVEGNRNNIIATVLNNLSPGFNSFPTAVTGIAYQAGTGNTAFSIYNENHARAPGTATGETAAFQDSAPSPTTYPFDESSGTTQTLAKGWQIGGATTNVNATGNTSNGSVTLTSVAGFVSPATVGSIVEGAGIQRNSRVVSIGAGTINLDKPATATATGVALKVFNAAATGIDIVREGSTLGQLNYGITYKPGSVLLYGLYMDATASAGSENGAYLAIPGDTGANLILKTAGAAVTPNKMLDLQRADGTSMASITQGGSGTFAGTLRANTGFSANGTAGLSVTKTVRDSAGTGTCTLIFTMGLLTGGTC